MSSTSSEIAIRLRQLTNDDLSAETRVTEVLNSLRGGGALEHLLNYQERDLYSELEETTLARAKGNNGILNLFSEETLRRREYGELWGKNLKSRNTAFRTLLFFAHIVPYCGLCALFTIMGRSASPDVIAIFPTIILLVAISSFAIIYSSVKRRTIDVWNKTSGMTTRAPKPIGLFLLCLVFLYVSVLLTVTVILVPPNAGAANISLEIFFLVLFVGFSIGYVIYEKRLMDKQQEADSSVRNLYRRENILRTRQLKKIDRQILAVANEVITDITSKYNLDWKPWSTTVPDYPRERSWKGLGEQYETYIETRKLKKLKSSILTLPKGSFGIAGERGTGKTAMMRRLEKEFDVTRDHILTVWMSAPTSVNERELPISILAKVATRVGAYVSNNPSWPDYPPAHHTKREQRRQRSIHVAWAIAVAAWGVFLYELASVLSIDLGVVQVPFRGFSMAVSGAALGIVVIICAYARGYWSLPRHLLRILGEDSKKLSEDERELASISANLLEELWYERKDSLSSNVSFSLGGSSLGGGVGQEKKREPFTLPHLVDLWQAYIEYITTGNSPFDKVVIFIDEVDKLASRTRIEQFVRVIKALYDASNVIFVVSISKDAYQLFERRFSSSIGRNVFDSSFADVIWVHRLSCHEVEKLLQSRISGTRLPKPVVQFIWARSKGNPRDAQRLAAEVIRSHKEEKLKKVAAYLLSRYCRSLLYPYWTDVASKGFHSDALSSLISKQTDIDGIGVYISGAIKDVKDWINRSSDSYDDKNFLGGIIVELQYASTLHSIFCVNEDQSIFEKIDEQSDREKDEVSCEKMIRNVQGCLSRNLIFEAQQLLDDVRRTVNLPAL